MQQHQPPLDNKDIAAAILAGGLARRMGGRNKATLHVGERRIIDRQLALLRQVAEPVFVVSNRPADFHGLPVGVERDVLPIAGALSGIYTAVAVSPRARTLVVACDMPFLNLAFLERLTRPSDADVVIPRSAAGVEPLCAVWHSRCAPALRRRIERGDLKAAHAVEDLRVEEIGPETLASYDPDGLLFVNVNTALDFEKAQEQARHGA
jgi:molybdopterin-guanine dinucleotide biosynthesis protein A